MLEKLTKYFDEYSSNCIDRQCESPAGKILGKDALSNKTPFFQNADAFSIKAGAYGLIITDYLLYPIALVLNYLGLKKVENSLVDTTAFAVAFLVRGLFLSLPWLISLFASSGDSPHLNPERVSKISP